MSVTAHCIAFLYGHSPPYFNTKGILLEFWSAHYVSRSKFYNLIKGEKMKREKLKKGVLISVMRALAYRLNIQYPNTPSRKIKGMMLESYKSYSKEEQDTFELLKAKAWLLVESRFEGEVNIPIAMTELFWSFPDVFGKKAQVWIDKMDDLIVSNLEYDELVSKSKNVSEWYVELIDKVIFNYMRDNK